MTLAPRPTRAGARRAAIAAVRAPQRAVLLAAGALLLAACSSGSDSAERQVKTAATATATAQTALSAWLAGDAPADYARAHGPDHAREARQGCRGGRGVRGRRGRPAGGDAQPDAPGRGGARARRGGGRGRRSRAAPSARAPRPRRRRRALPPLPPATGRRRDEQAPGDLARHRHQRRRLLRGRLDRDARPGRGRLRLPARSGPLVLGTILVIFLVEMSGRFAAVSRQALPDAIREHFGFNFCARAASSSLMLVHLPRAGAPRSAASASPSTCDRASGLGVGASGRGPRLAASCGGRPSASSRTACRCSASSRWRSSWRPVMLTRPEAGAAPACADACPTTTRRATGSSPSASWARRSRPISSTSTPRARSRTNGTSPTSA